MQNLNIEIKTDANLFSKKSWLQRLFESDIFNVAFAVQYLFTIKEPGILSYLGNRLFKFLPEDVDFYIPQLITMYKSVEKVADAIRPYIYYRCESSVEFLLECHWLSESYGLTSSLEFCLPRQLVADEKLIVDELKFVENLMKIGFCLKDILTKEEKSKRLIHELFMLNFSLPAKVWLPLYSSKCIHIVLRINYTDGCILNSKDKAPYCMYVEVLEIDDVYNCELPIKLDDNEKNLDYDSLLIQSNLNENNTVNINNDINNESNLEKENKLKTKDVNQKFLIEDNVESKLTFFDSLLMKNTISISNSEWLNKDFSDEKNLEEVLTAEKEEKSDTTFEQKNFSKKKNLLPALSVITKDSSNYALASTSNSPPLPTYDSKMLLSPKSQQRRRQQITHTVEDPSASTMSEPWDEKEKRLRKSSPYGYLHNWKLMAVIVKTGDDLRQELLAYQLLTTLQKIWAEENIPLYVRPYKIFICSQNSGFIEPIPNACSLHQIKKHLTINPRYDDNGQLYPPTLLSHFFISYGSKLSMNFMRAQENFVRSCAAYCLVCYLLQVKDRHNGNILLDHDGHLIHIDFGYILSMSPRNLGFETSPFKLTQEQIDVMFGTKTEIYARFKWLMLQGLIAARKHHERLINLVEIMITGSQLPCFRGGQNVLRLMRERFHINSTDTELQNLIDLMVEQSRDSLTTRLYDNFQYYTNGIF